MDEVHSGLDIHVKTTFKIVGWNSYRYKRVLGSQRQTLPLGSRLDQCSDTALGRSEIATTHVEIMYAVEDQSLFNGGPLRTLLLHLQG